MNEKLQIWKERYINAEREYSARLAEFDAWTKQYKGDREIVTDGRRGKNAAIVRNFTFELVETQIDNTIPMPKVSSPVHSEKKEKNARAIEAMLRSVVRKIAPERTNSEEDRMTKILGQSFRLVGWDSSKNTHTTCGEPFARLLHPKQVVPQPGVSELENADYVFVTFTNTKSRLNRRYGVIVEPDGTEDSDGEQSETVTQVTAYYINSEGTLGVFSWAGNTVLEDYEKYRARLVYECPKCGTLHAVRGERCSCGGKASVAREKFGEELFADLKRSDGSVIRAKETSGGVEKRTVLPYYTPSVFPIIMRKNVSLYGRFGGESDCGLIADLQTAHNKLYSKVQEKLLKGGSVLTLPRGVRIETSDREDKLVFLDNTAQKAMIDAINLQPSVQQDLQLLDKYYEDARSTLGITDAYQGKQDNTAMSGTAKQFSAAQAAGRIESKIRLKNMAYCDLFKALFQYMLAYADEPRTYGESDSHEHDEVFCRYDFLERDADGEWYYDDDYIFEVDSSAALLSDRQAMWAEVRSNFNDGTFGDRNDEKTLRTYWNQLEQLDYPNAGAVRKSLASVADTLGEASGAENG